jgi:hypothetical protein
MAWIVDVVYVVYVVYIVCIGYIVYILYILYTVLYSLIVYPPSPLYIYRERDHGG